MVLPVPCPPARPTRKGFLLLTYFTIQKHIGIKKDFNMPSLLLNFSFEVSCDLINLKQSFFTLSKQIFVDCIENYFFWSKG